MVTEHNFSERRRGEALHHERVTLPNSGQRGSTLYGSTSIKEERDGEGTGALLESYRGSYASASGHEVLDNNTAGDSGWSSWCRWTSAGEFFAAVATRGNVWDSPQSHGIRESASERSFLSVWFWLSVLAAGYAVERGSFKLLVDRTGPFRLFSAEAITAVHTIILSSMVLTRSLQTRSFELKVACLPFGDIALMAVLDTMHLLLVVVTGAYVAPTLTVILVQLTVPLTAMFGHLVRSNDSGGRGFCRTSGSCFSQVVPSLRATYVGQSESEEQGDMAACVDCRKLLTRDRLGATVILSAVTLGLLPSFLSMLGRDILATENPLSVRCAYNTIIFALGCVPSAASQLYKEHALLQHRQPVDSNSLNLVLSAFQFSLVMVMSPLIYVFQGLGAGSNWIDLYPPMDIRLNFIDGLKCFFGVLDHDQASSLYPEQAHCEWSLSIVVLHVTSILLVGKAVDKIVHAGATKVVHLGVSVGIVLAILIMCAYEHSDARSNVGAGLNTFCLSCTLLLLFGLGLLNPMHLSDSTFETSHPDQDNLYEEG